MPTGHLFYLISNSAYSRKSAFFSAKITLFFGFKKTAAVFCLCLTLFAAANAQYQIKSWTNDGMAQNTLRSILQTPDGYLLMTTLDGLARFDGVRFTIYNKSNTKGFGTNRLNHLIQSPDGDLWIGAETDFVIRFHAGAFTTFALN